MVRMELSGEVAGIDYAVVPEAIREPICRRATNRDDGNLDDASGRMLPTVKAFSVQCSSCLKWRLIPTKEMYEEIRQVVTENPFFCSRASTWRPHASCNDPSDLSQDTSLLWAIDKPDIPLAPAGWERLLVFRGEGSSKFADVRGERVAANLQMFLCWLVSALLSPITTLIVVIEIKKAVGVLKGISKVEGVVKLVQCRRVMVPQQTWLPYSAIVYEDHWAYTQQTWLPSS